MDMDRVASGVVIDAAIYALLMFLFRRAFLAEEKKKKRKKKKKLGQHSGG